MEIIQHEEVEGKTYRKFSKQARAAIFVLMFTLLILHMMVHFSGPSWLEGVLWISYMLSLMLMVLDIKMNMTLSTAYREAEHERIKRMLDDIDRTFLLRRRHYESEEQQETPLQ